MPVEKNYWKEGKMEFFKKINFMKKNKIKNAEKWFPPKSNINDFSRFIVVDEDNKPMAWDKDQFCYCTNSHWQDDHFPIRTYSKKYAMELIKRSIAFRKKNKFVDLGDYLLMPVY